MPDMASNKSVTRITRCHVASFFDTMSGVKKLANFIPAINSPTSANEASIMLIAMWQLQKLLQHTSKILSVEARSSFEDSNAEVGQLIAGMKFSRFLTPDMASKS